MNPLSGKWTQRIFIEWLLTYKTLGVVKMLEMSPVWLFIAFVNVGIPGVEI
jgi:hypothetical protein